MGGARSGRDGRRCPGTCSQISFGLFEMLEMFEMLEVFESIETLETFEMLETFQMIQIFLGGGGSGRLRRPGQESETSTSKPLILTAQKLTRQGKQTQKLVNDVFGLEYIGILSQRLVNIRFSQDRARSPEQGLVNW